MKSFINFTTGVKDFLLGKKSINKILKSEGANLKTLLDIEDLNLNLRNNLTIINDL